MGDPFYDQFAIKKYAHWTLNAHERQSYLGRAVVWLERDGDMQRLSSLSEEERDELWNVVLPEYENAAQELFQPSHMNYAWLGNDFHLHKGHGHLHLIPRYEALREFAGRIFVDNEWGKHYALGAGKDLPIELAHAVRDAFKSKLSNILA